jgi:hypothetical protein
MGMGMVRSSLRRLGAGGVLLYGAGILLMILLVLLTFLFGSLAATVAASVCLAGFLYGAPFVLSGRWRPAKPEPTRRPVIRRRRY